MFKRLTMVAFVGAAFLCSTAVTSANAACSKDQYLVGKTCTACPKNATCNGTKAVCKSGFREKITSGKTSCVCPDDKYLVDGKCTTCPTHATCNGKTATCAATFQAAINKSTGKTTCSCGTGYFAAKSNKCYKCPTNATCKSSAYTCNSGFTASVTNEATGEVACTCAAGKYIKDKNVLPVRPMLNAKEQQHIPVRRDMKRIKRVIVLRHVRNHNIV